MKSLKARIVSYFLILLAGLVLVVGLLLTGYDYTKSKGFFVSQERSPMNFGEALSNLPGELLWFMLAFLLIIFLVEVVVLAIRILRRRGLQEPDYRQRK
jgi:ABC-type Na+ efflux pump permease subunit